MFYIYLPMKCDSVCYPQGRIDKGVKNFSKRLKACVGAGGGHFENVFTVTIELWRLIIS